MPRNHWDNQRDKYDVLSPDEDDPFFPYVTENTGNIKLPTGQNLVDLFSYYTILIVTECMNVPLFKDPEYDADTDDVIESSNCKKKVKRKYTFQNECVNIADSVRFGV
jgi:hypothetical protein